MKMCSLEPIASITTQDGSGKDFPMPFGALVEGGISELNPPKMMCADGNSLNHTFSLSHSLLTNSLILIKYTKNIISNIHIVYFLRHSASWE
jgi:hypothetical protein